MTYPDTKKLIELLKVVEPKALIGPIACQVFNCRDIFRPEDGHLYCEDCPFDSIDAIDALIAELEEATKC